jgi:hypothetical protein
MPIFDDKNNKNKKNILKELLNFNLKEVLQQKDLFTKKWQDLKDKDKLDKS